MRYTFILTLVTLISLTFASTSRAEGYFPSSVGLSWTYSNGETQTLSSQQDIGGQTVTVLTHYLAGNPVSEDYLSYRPEGVFSHGTVAGGRSFLYDPPLVVYQGDTLRVGQAWQSSTRLAGLEITFRAEVLAVQGVQTPAGRFNALHIRQETITSTGAQTALELFFVPSVGVVRFVTQDGTMVDLLEKNF